MLRRKVDAWATRIVWRMTTADPVSLDIDLTDPKSAAQTPPNLSDRGWLESSYELRHGLDVREVALDALPDDLFGDGARSRR